MNHKRCIVLGEDNRSDIFLVKRALSQIGLDYELFVIEDVQGAKSLLARVGDDVPCPDLLLMDLNLPRTDGTELIRMFRDNPNCKSVPVIVVTSSDSPKDRARVADLGVNEYFRKPSDLTEFMRLGDLVSAVLRNSQH